MSFSVKDIFKKGKDKIFSHPLTSSFLTLAGFIFLIFLSWVYLNPSYWDTEEEQIHSQLQNQFQTLLSDFVAEKHPQVDEIIFHRVWTKKSSDSSLVEIFFTYSLRTNEGSAPGDLLIEGQANLERSMEREDLWLVQDFHIKDTVVTFSKPLLIKSDTLPQDDLN